MRVTTAFSRLLRLPGVWVRNVRFEPDRVVGEVALRRRLLVSPSAGTHARSEGQAAGGFGLAALGSVKSDVVV